MKKLLMMVALAVTTLSASAQNAVGQVSLKPMVGMTVASLTDLDGTDAKIGLAAGIEAEFGVADRFGITAGAIYSMQGAKSDYHEHEIRGDEKIKLEYINIPILANFYAAPGLAFKVGIQPGFNVSSKAKYEVMGKSVEQDLDGVKSVDFSIPVGISYEISNFVIDARYQWGLTKVADDSDSKNSVFMFSLGYKFAL